MLRAYRIRATGHAHGMENPYKPEPAIIKEVRRETYDTTTYVLEFEDKEVQDTYSFSPGQFNMMTLLGIGEAPISISSHPDEGSFFQHTVRHVGDVTNRMRLLKPGQKIWMRGPYGTGWPMEILSRKDLLIIAGGIGLAPLRPVIEAVMLDRAEYGEVEVLYGARTPDDMLYTQEFNRWSEKMRFRKTADRVDDRSKWDGSVGVVTQLFEGMKVQARNTVVLTCGPEVMMQFAVKGLLERGFCSEQIYVSLERRMECGVGKCGRCQIGPKFVCKDGPVFAFAELLTLPEEVMGGVGR